jgi:hypothetical protein
METVKIDFDSGIACTLNRPDKRNAMSPRSTERRGSEALESMIAARCW